MMSKMQATSTLLLALLAHSAQHAAAHVTLSPNYGAASGNYFVFDVKIPHGMTGKDTTKIEITVPHGVLSVKPEAVYGWDIETEERDVIPYMSHGTAVTKGPAKITYTARCDDPNGNGDTCNNPDHGGLDNDHLMMLSMQIKLGCDFGVDKDNVGTNDATVWQDQHTIWWPVAQWASTEGTNDGNGEGTAHMDWLGVAQGSESWQTHNGPKPSPYLFIYSDEKCTPPENSGSDTPVGMRWGVNSEVIPPVADQDPIKTKAELLSIMNEEMLDLEEKITDLNTDMMIKIADIEMDKSEIKHCAIIALCVACILMVAFLTLCVFRVSKPQHFREYLLSAPLIQSHEGKSVEIGAV